MSKQIVDHFGEDYGRDKVTKHMVILNLVARLKTLRGHQEKSWELMKFGRAVVCL